MAAKSRTNKKAQRVPGVVVSDSPAVYLAAVPGFWLLKHSTPSWRAQDPQKGFQRIVKEQRAREIARLVIECGRTFPNAITLATSRKTFTHSGGEFDLPASTKFLVVDGQHRLFAQGFSTIEAQYPCVIHMGCTEEQMARLFLEINDNQRRVPSSLRWDLVRLVRSDDKSVQMTSDIVFELVNRSDSAFNEVGIDLTGENKDITIKQGSLAPEIKTLISRTLKRSKGEFEDYVELLMRFFAAIRSIDPDGWGDPKSSFFRARVLRALLRVLTELLLKQSFAELTTSTLREYLTKIDPATLSEERLRLAQGSAGVQDLYKAISEQVGVGQTV